MLISILKVFSYYNQLGDGFFKDLTDMNVKIEGLEQEFKHLLKHIILIYYYAEELERGKVLLSIKLWEKKNHLH